MVWGWQWQTKGPPLTIKSEFARQRQDRESKEVMFVLRQSPVHPTLGCSSPLAARGLLLEGGYAERLWPGGPDPSLGSGDPVLTPAGKAACGEKGAGISPRHLRPAGCQGCRSSASSKRGLLFAPGWVAAVHPRGAAPREKPRKKTKALRKKGAADLRRDPAWRRRGGREQREPEPPKADACGRASLRAGRRRCLSVPLSRDPSPARPALTPGKGLLSHGGRARSLPTAAGTSRRRQGRENTGGTGHADGAAGYRAGAEAGARRWRFASPPPAPVLPPRPASAGPAGGGGSDGRRGVPVAGEDGACGRARQRRR